MKFGRGPLENSTNGQPSRSSRLSRLRAASGWLWCRAIIRRSEGISQNEIKCGDLLLSPLSFKAELKGEELNLSKKEFALLHALMLSSGRVLTKGQLEDQLYSWGHEVESNAVEVHIHNLRKKIGANYIQTIRGVGYQFKD